MPSRRAYLATLAAAGLAGCVSNSPDSTTEAPTDTTTKASTTSSRPTVTIEAVAVQYSYRHIASVDWNAIRTTDGQFVFVTIDASEAESVPNRAAFTLTADDERHDPIALEEARYPVDLGVPGEPYRPSEEGAKPRGWLLFDVPAQLDTAPSLRLDRHSNSWTWNLDTEMATAPPPAWEWTASAPETVVPDETFEITVTAENVGEGPGTFRGAVNFSYPMYRPKEFDIVLDPGASGETTVSAQSAGADPGRQLEYGIRTPAGKTSVTVTVKDTSIPTNSSN